MLQVLHHISVKAKIFGNAILLLGLLLLSSFYALDSMESIGKELTAILQQHDAFVDHSQQAFQLFDQGKFARAGAILEKIELEEDELTKSMQTLLAEIETFTREATERAEAHELEAVDVLTTLLIVALLVGGVSTWVTSSAVVNPIVRLTRGLADVEKTCQYDKRVAVVGSDEVAQAGVAFNNLMQSQQTAIGSVNKVMANLASGVFGHRVNEPLVGDLQQLKAAVNSTADVVENSFKEFNSIMTGAEKGDFSARLSLDLKGELANTKNAINNSMTTLEKAIDEIVVTAESQRAGNLGARVSGSYMGKLAILKNALNSSAESVNKAVDEITAVIGGLRQGDFSQRIKVELHGDLDQLKEHVNESMQLLSDAMEEIVNVSQAQQLGDLKRRISGHYQGQLEVLQQAINSSADQLEKTLSKIRQASATVALGSNEILTGVTDLSQRTEEQASSLEETASSMEQMTSAVDQSTENSVQAAELADNAKQIAETSGAIVEKAVSSMAQINQSSKEISDIIVVIDEIAFQTNLLALNAAVEAARAGEQGRGFSVVAGEVRALAQRSAEAAKQIKGLIGDSSKKVEEGTDLVNRAGQSLQEILESSQKVTNAIKSIRDASLEQRSGIQQVNISVTQMDEMTQQNAALVEEASAAVQSVNNEIEGMVELVKFFQVSGGAESGPGRLSANQATVTAYTPATSAPTASVEQDSDDEWDEF